MTELFSDGFESGNFTSGGWTAAASGSGSASVTTDTPHQGSYSAKFVCDAYGYARASKDLGSNYATAFLRTYVYFSSFASTLVDKIQHAEDRSSNGIWDLYISSSTLRLRALQPSQTDYDYSYSFQTDTWCCIEIKFVSDATNGEYRVWLDGSEVITATGLDTSGASGLGIFYIGYLYTEASRTSYVDDVVVADTYIGPIGGGGLSIPVAMRHYRNLRTAITTPKLELPKITPLRI